MTDPAEGGPVDRLNERIGVLTRREVEVRLLAELLPALGRKFGAVEVLEVLRAASVAIARRQGCELAQRLADNSLAAFRGALAHWTRDEALALDVISDSERELSFNVTRCRYAELYRELGVPELGPVFSCARDYALIEGFNPRIRLTRTQTLMEGAAFCDFRYRLEA
jgi:hypothetical protein